MLRSRLGLLCCSQLVATSALRLPSAAAPFVRCAAPHRGVLARMMCDDAPPPPTFGMLDVRVGKIVEAWEHPDSDKLWVEKIDVGEVEVEGEGEEAKETPAPRQIASGLRAHYATAADLEGRAVIVVCNLKEAKLGGVPSNGMVLCASGDDGTVAFVEPPAGAAPGERIVVEGIMEDPASPNKVKKKKLMEKSAEELRAVDNVACYRGVPLSTSAGPCTSPVNGPIN
jgi:methionine--tRNA ligase beta chain